MHLNATTLLENGGDPGSNPGRGVLLEKYKNPYSLKIIWLLKLEIIGIVRKEFNSFTSELNIKEISGELNTIGLVTPSVLYIILAVSRIYKG